MERFFSTLTWKQKENISLLQVGTFFEYFDLMLYIHMAVVLNDIFFPPSDIRTSAFFTAFAFCSSYVFRPFGALVFGYIGDHYGRKSTILITMFIMSFSCIVMANLPTYAQWGITATWLMILCRALQGISSIGEIVGAEIYITEILDPPIQYPAVAFIAVSATLGGTVALCIATFIINAELSWRFAFWIGVLLSFVGFCARKNLRETPEYLDTLNRRIKIENDAGADVLIKFKKFFSRLKFDKELKEEKINYKILFSSFALYCAWPLTFYLGFIYFIPFLKDVCGYSLQDIIFHNLLLSLVSFFSGGAAAFLSYKIHPFTILKVKGILFLCYSIILPYLIQNAMNGIHIFMIQSIIFMIALGSTPAESILIKIFPVFKRFTITSFLNAISRAGMYVMTSFGLVFLTGKFGQWGLYFMTIPTVLVFLWAVHHLALSQTLKEGVS